MIFKNLTQKYSSLEAWVHDHLIADRALNLHAYILEGGKLIPVLTEKKARRMLDVGCGGGQSAIRLKELYPHLVLVGIDLSAEQIARAQDRARRKGLSIQFEVADAQCLPFPDESFDIIYSFGSAKHWPDPLKGLGECWRVLKPEGELLVADATSDATLEQVENFYAIAHFPKLFQKPVATMLHRRMFRPARSVETYRQIAAQLQMPADSVSQLPFMPAFLFRTQKPQPDITFRQPGRSGCFPSGNLKV
ncbi:MAG TPA: class I SAM-dependent methyltransferase [Candidatus Acidoferrum sp.]|nr:class I SAM-dependent methyltransferase [Candidatus Acidoferrum sp.]